MHKLVGAQWMRQMLAPRRDEAYARTANVAPTRDRFERTRFTWANYWALGYFSFLQSVLGPIMPFLRSDLRLSYTVASLHFSAFAFGGVLMGSLGERISGRWGRTVAFWGGAAGMAAGTLALVFSRNAVGTILGAFTMGFLGVLLLVTIQAILADRHGRWRAVALTEANVVASVFAILASVAAGVFAGAGLGWRPALLLPLAFLVLLAFHYRDARFEQVRPRADTTSPAVPADAHLPKQFWAFWLLIMLETAVEWCVAYWGATFLTSAGGLGPAGAATATGAFFLAMVIGRYAGSWATRRLPGKTILLAALGVASAGFPLFWLAPTPALHVAGLFIVGLGLANVYPAAVALGTGTAPEQANRASARLTLASSGAVLVAPAVLGALADYVGIGRAFGIALPLLLGALGSLFLASRLASAPPAKRSAIS